MKLSKAQQELLDAMKKGVRVHFIGGINAHYFRADTFRACSPSARALERAGLVRRINQDWRGYQLEALQSATQPTADGNG